MEVLCLAHPYFVGALGRGLRTFDHLYDTFIDLYPLEDDHEDDDLDV